MDCADQVALVRALAKLQGCVSCGQTVTFTLPVSNLENKSVSALLWEEPTKYLRKHVMDLHPIQGREGGKWTKSLDRFGNRTNPCP